jgi:hypothetical protein
MFKGIGALRKQPRLVEELGGLKMRQATLHCHLGQFRNSLQQGQGHLGANDCSGLEELLLLRG